MNRHEPSSQEKAGPLMASRSEVEASLARHMASPGSLATSGQHTAHHFIQAALHHLSEALGLCILSRRNTSSSSYTCNSPPLLSFTSHRELDANRNPNSLFCVVFQFLYPSKCSGTLIAHWSTSRQTLGRRLMSPHHCLLYHPLPFTGR